MTFQGCNGQGLAMGGRVGKAGWRRWKEIIDSVFFEVGNGRYCCPIDEIRWVFLEAEE
jgi:hypothetical protein